MTKVLHEFGTAVARIMSNDMKSTCSGLRERCAPDELTIKKLLWTVSLDNLNSVLFFACQH